MSLLHKQIVGALRSFDKLRMTRDKLRMTRGGNPSLCHPEETKGLAVQLRLRSFDKLRMTRDKLRMTRGGNPSLCHPEGTKGLAVRLRAGMAILSLAVLLLFAGQAFAVSASNFAFGTTSSVIANADGGSATFTVANGTNSGDFPTANFLVVVYSASCQSASTCAARELILITSRSGSTFTISARNQEATTHSADWASGSKIQNIFSAGLANIMQKRSITWLGCSIAVGGAPGGVIPLNMTVTSIMAYTIGTSCTVTFNIEERTTPGSAGTDIMTSDLVATTSGVTQNSFAHANLTAGNRWWIDYSATSGTCTGLEITMEITTQ